MPLIDFTRHGRYIVTSELMRDRSGSILDIGARDNVMRSHLGGLALDYESADVSGEQDYLVDLEQVLPFADQAFDYTLALDVIEHVDNIHQALAEILRITRLTAIVSLPNMSSYRGRFEFLLNGALPTTKYDLPTEPVADRHRWLTTARDIVPFFQHYADISGFCLERVVWQAEGRRVGSRVALIALRSGLPLIQILAARATGLFVRQ
jgi:SAM-dependent methyltransferase